MHVDPIRTYNTYIALLMGVALECHTLFSLVIYQNVAGHKFEKVLWYCRFLLRVLRTILVHSLLSATS